MRKLVLGLAVASLVGVSGLSAVAEEDPIVVRKAIMDSVGGAAGLAGGMMKGDIAYTPAAGKAAILTMRAASMTLGNYFPDGSEMGDTSAALAIWDEPEKFQEALAKFADTANAAAAASGKDGPADLDAFKAAMGPVMGNCKSCHEAFRVKN